MFICMLLPPSLIVILLHSGGRVLAPMSPSNHSIFNTTDQQSCGVRDIFGGRGCDLTGQPCHYIVAVGDVFKGNYSVSIIMNSC